MVSLIAVALVSSLWAAPPPRSEQVEVPLGPCAGPDKWEPPKPLGGPAGEISASRIRPWSRAFRLAGYRYEPGARRLIGPDGRSVSEAEFDRLRADVDASKQRIDHYLWLFLSHGYRLDKECHFYSKKGADRSEHLKQIELMALRAVIRERQRQDVLAYLLGRLSALPPHQPPPPELVRDVLTLEKKTGVPLPASLRAALLAGRTPAAILGARVQPDYLRSLKVWDGARKPQYVLPVIVPGLTAPPSGGWGFVESDEHLLGDFVSAHLQRAFARTPSGRALLGHFRDADGVLSLPPMKVLKNAQRPGESTDVAHYDPGEKSVTFNQWVFLKALLRAAPARDRAALAASSDAQLTFYLRAHPDIADQVIDRIDVTAFHELIHAWQDRRMRLGAEGERRNAPTADPIDEEQEAWLAQTAYLGDKLALSRDPARAAEDAHFQYYLEALKDPAAYRKMVEHLYFKNVFGAATLKTMRATQEMRRLALADGQSPDSLKSILREMGFENGDAALDEAQRSLTAQIAGLTQGVRRMREQALNQIVPRLERDRPDLAWRIYLAAQPHPDRRGLDLAMKVMDFMPRAGSRLSAFQRLPAEIPAARTLQDARAPIAPESLSRYRDDLGVAIRDVLKQGRRDPENLREACSLSLLLPLGDSSRYETAQALSDAKRPDLALLALGLWGHGWTADFALRRALVRRVIPALRGSKPGSEEDLLDRLNLFTLVDQELKREAKPFPGELVSIYLRDAHRHAGLLIERGRFAEARKLLAPLPPDDPELAKLRARLRAAERR